MSINQEVTVHKPLNPSPQSRNIIPDVDTLVARRASLEVQYVALRSPVTINLKLKNGSETSVLTTIKSVPSADMSKASEVESTPVDQGTVSDDTRLPPKLQLSRD